jgi:hypothetical protein
MARYCSWCNHHGASLHRREISYWVVHRNQHRCLDLWGRRRPHRVNIVGLLHKSDLFVWGRTHASICQVAWQQATISDGPKTALACIDAGGANPGLHGVRKRHCPTACEKETSRFIRIGLRLDASRAHVEKSSLLFEDYRSLSNRCPLFRL